jgi:hypothetical protein
MGVTHRASEGSCLLHAKPRTRLLSLRMTEEEYCRLRDTADIQGARSVSEFARKALLAAARPASVTDTNGFHSLDALADRIARVEQDLDQVKRSFQ